MYRMLFIHIIALNPHTDRVRLKIHHASPKIGAFAYLINKWKENDV